MEDKYLTCIYILDYYHKMIAARTSAIERLNFNRNRFHREMFSPDLTVEDKNILIDQRLYYMSLVNMNIIDLNSYNDEYEKNFRITLTESDSKRKRILELQIKLKPLRKAIDWVQLKSYRNHLLAHNLRTKNGEISLPVLKDLNDNVLGNTYIALEYFKQLNPLYECFESHFSYDIDLAKDYIKLKAGLIK